ncbi:MAG: hypothetical protein ACTSV7_14915 [Candidatus Baldrarchaeia archaeon]
MPVIKLFGKDFFVDSLHFSVVGIQRLGGIFLIPRTKVPLKETQKEEFWLRLKNDVVSYSVRPLGRFSSGERTVKSPNLWKVFITEKEMPFCRVIKVFERNWEVKKGLEFHTRPYEIRIIDLRTKKWAHRNVLYKPDVPMLFNLVDGASADAEYFKKLYGLI